MKKLLLIAVVVAGMLIVYGCNQQPDPVMKNTADSLAVDSTATDTSVQVPDDWQQYTYAERRGKAMFVHYCVICHGKAGEGDGFNAFNLNPKPHSLADSAYVSALSDAILQQVIGYGGRGVNKSIQMPAYQFTMSDRQIGYVVDYIRTLVRE